MKISKLNIGDTKIVAASFLAGGLVISVFAYVRQLVLYGAEQVPVTTPLPPFLLGGLAVAGVVYFHLKNKRLLADRLIEKEQTIIQLERAVEERTADLRANEERLRTQYAAVPIPTYTWQRDGDDFRLIDFNEAAKLHTQGAVDKFMGSSLNEMYADRPDIIAEVNKCFSEQVGLQSVRSYSFENIGDRQLDIRYAFAAPDLVIAHTEDVTERRRDEAAIAESERRYRHLYNETPVMMHSIDLEGTLIDANDYWIETLGYERSEVIGNSLKNVLTEDSWKYAIDVNLPKFAKYGFCRDVPYQMKKKNGEIIDLLLSAVAEKDSAGNFYRSIAVMVDITEENRAKEQSRSAQDMLYNAIESIDEGIMLYDADDRFVLCNSQTRKHLPDTSKYLVPGTKFEDIVRSIYANDQVELHDGLGLEEGVRRAMEFHVNPQGPRYRTERDGSWILINEYQTSSGGTLIVRTDLTDLKTREEELERAKEVAEAASQAKSEFLSSMSHELKTPMNAILGYGQLLGGAGNRDLSDHHIQNYAGEIIKGGRHLLSLIDQILDLSKIESGDLDLSIEKIDPAGAISECVSIIGGHADERRLTVTDQTREASMPMLMTDEARFRQAMLNLLTNAAKYNVRGGAVTITTSPGEDNFQRFSVIDTGSGIAREKQKNLFEPFNRLGREAGAIKGTGIGLTVTKQIVETLGGKIGFESEEGIGSVFWIELPIWKQDPAHAVPDGTGRLN
ncbi:MAG: PAS domain S-box protein [Rhodospirillales bacterium]|nr:PAS domain S-box protein [Rhodospirillales bacterium]